VLVGTVRTLAPHSSASIAGRLGSQFHALPQSRSRHEFRIEDVNHMVQAFIALASLAPKVGAVLAVTVRSVLIAPL